MKSGFLYQYYYLWSVALLVPFWVLIFFVKKRHWEEILYIGILCGAGAMFFDRYISFRDYWRPPTLSDLYNFESFLYGFFYGGISAKIFEFAAGTDYSPTKIPNPLLLGGVILINAVIFIAMRMVFPLNSVENFVAMLLITSALLVLIRRDLYKVCLFSGLLMVVFNVCWYGVILLIYPDVFKDIWNPVIQKSPSLFNIPILEYWFILAVGCSGSMVYKVMADSRIVSPADQAIEDGGEAPGAGRLVLRYAVRLWFPFFTLGIVLFRMIVFGTTPIHLKKLLSFFL